MVDKIFAFGGLLGAANPIAGLAAALGLAVGGGITKKLNDEITTKIEIHNWDRSGRAVYASVSRALPTDIAGDTYLGRGKMAVWTRRAGTYTVRFKMGNLQRSLVIVKGPEDCIITFRDMGIDWNGHIYIYINVANAWYYLE